MNVLIMPLHLVHLALSPVTILPLTLTHLPVVVIVTASARSWKKCIVLELKQHRYVRTGVSAAFLTGFFVSLNHAFAPLVVLLSAFFPRVHFALQERQWKAQLRVSLPRRVLEKVLHTTCGILSWNLLHEQDSSILLLSVDEFDLAQIALSCHFALDLLCFQEGAHNAA